MREELRTVCTEFIKDKEIAKEAFAWDNSYLHPICAGILAEKKRCISAEELKNYKQMIKDKTDIFSNFRGYCMIPMACMLAVSENADMLLNDTLKVYEILKNKYWSSQYLPLVAMIVVQMAEPSEYEHIVEEAGEIYTLMKEAHPFLTSSEDGPFATMLAFTEKSAKEMNEEVERCYELLKPSFFSSNAVQSLSHVMALGEGTAEEKCGKFMTLFEDLRARGYKYGTDYELSTLGALSILPADAKGMVDEMIEVTDYLENQSGYGFFGFSKRHRMMHAAMLIGSTYVEKSKGPVMNSAALGSTMAMIAAQQAALCATLVATTAASTASN